MDIMRIHLNMQVKFIELILLYLLITETAFIHKILPIVPYLALFFSTWLNKSKH